MPALAIAAFTLLDAHGVALAGDGAARSWRGDRARVVAALQAAPETDLRRHYLHCAFASNERLLAPEESILCVLVADALLQRAFAGDFAALIAWYQGNRQPALALQPRP